MVRETRYLWVGNLPDNVSEERISDHFQSYGKIQSVKFIEDENGKAAIVAFVDIKCASKAHANRNEIEGNVVHTEYSEASGRGVKVTRSYDPESRSAGSTPRGIGGTSASRGGYGGEDSRSSYGYGDYYERRDGSGERWTSGSTAQAQQAGYYGNERGRARQRYPPAGQQHYQQYEGQYGGAGYASRQKSGSGSVQSPAQSEGSGGAASSSQLASRSRRAGDGGGGGRARRTDSERSSSSGSCGSRSTRSSSKRAKDRAVAPGGDSMMMMSGGGKVSSQFLGLMLRGFPARSSDTSLRDGLFHEYKKFGKVMSVKINGEKENRLAIVTFKKGADSPHSKHRARLHRHEDAKKALDTAREKGFFGKKLVAEPHEGIQDESAGDVFRPPEADLDEYHHKATRTLFVGNLNKDSNKDELKSVFRHYGIILDIDIKNQQPNQVFAFVQFDNIKSVVRALHEMDGENIGRSNVKVKLGFGRSMPTNVLWVDNVTEQIQESYLKRQFSRNGPANYVLIDRETARALVFYDNNELAMQSLSTMRGRTIAGSRIQIDFASTQCMNALLDNMEATGQLRREDRPDQKGFRQYHPQGAPVAAEPAPTTPTGYEQDRAWYGQYPSGGSSSASGGAKVERSGGGSSSGGYYGQRTSRQQYYEAGYEDPAYTQKKRYESGYEDGADDSYEARRGEGYAYSKGDRASSVAVSPAYSRTSDKHSLPPPHATDDERHRSAKYDDRYGAEEKVRRSRAAASPGSEKSYRSSAAAKQRSPSVSPAHSRQSSRDKRAAYSPSPSRDEFSRHSSPDYSPRKASKSRTPRGPAPEKEVPKGYLDDSVDYKPSTSLMSEIQKTRPRKHPLKRESESELTELDKALQKQDLFGSPPLKRQATEEEVERSCRHLDAEYRRKVDEAARAPPRPGPAAPSTPSAGSHSIDYSGATAQEACYSGGRGGGGLEPRDPRTAPEGEIESKFSTPSPSSKSKGSESDKTPDSTERGAGSGSSGDISQLEREKQRLLSELQEMSSNGDSDGEAHAHAPRDDAGGTARKKARVEDAFELDWSPREASMHKWREQAKHLGTEVDHWQSKNSHTEPPPKPPDAAAATPSDSSNAPIDSKKSYRKQMEALRKDVHASGGDSHRGAESDSEAMDTADDSMRTVDSSFDAGGSPSNEFKKKDSADPGGKSKGRSYRTTRTDDLSFGSLPSGDEFVSELKPKRRISHYNKRDSVGGGDTDRSTHTDSETDGKSRSRSHNKSPAGGRESRRESTDSKRSDHHKDSHDSGSNKKEEKSSRKDRSSEKKKSGRGEPPPIPHETPDNKSPARDPRTPCAISTTRDLSIPLPKFADRFLKKISRQRSSHSSPSRSRSKDDRRDSSTESSKRDRRDSSAEMKPERWDSSAENTSRSAKADAKDSSLSEDNSVKAAKGENKTEVKRNPMDAEEAKLKELEIKEALISEIKSEPMSTSDFESCDKTENSAMDNDKKVVSDTETAEVKAEAMDTTEPEVKQELPVSQNTTVVEETVNNKPVAMEAIETACTEDTTTEKHESEAGQTKADKPLPNGETEKPEDNSVTNVVEQHSTENKENKVESVDSAKSDSVPKAESQVSTESSASSEKEAANKATVNSDKKVEASSVTPVATPNKARARDMSDSDTSDLDTSGGLSIDERLRMIDEKLNQAWTNEAMKRMTQVNTGNDSWNSATSSTLDYRDKYRVRKKVVDTGVTNAVNAEADSRSEQSDIARSLLLRSSIFDQDSKRLEQIDEKYQPKSYLNAGGFGASEELLKGGSYFTEPMTPNFATPVIRSSGQDGDTSMIGSSLMFAPPGSLANQKEKLTPPPLSRHSYLHKKPASLDSPMLGVTGTDLTSPTPLSAPPHMPRDPRFTPTSPTLSRDPRRADTTTSPSVGRDPRRDPLSPPVTMPLSILKKSPIATSPGGGGGSGPMLPLSRLSDPNAPPTPTLLSPPDVSKPSILKKTTESPLHDKGVSPVSILKWNDSTSSSVSTTSHSNHNSNASASSGTGHSSTNKNEADTSAVPLNEFSFGDGPQYQSTPSPPVLTKQTVKPWPQERTGSSASSSSNPLKRRWTKSGNNGSEERRKGSPDDGSETSPPRLDSPMPMTDGTMDEPPALAAAAIANGSPKSPAHAANPPTTPRNNKPGAKCSDEVTTPDSHKSQSPPSEPESKKARLDPTSSGKKSESVSKHSTSNGSSSKTSSSSAGGSSSSGKTQSKSAAKNNSSSSQSNNYSHKHSSSSSKTSSTSSSSNSTHSSATGKTASSSSSRKTSHTSTSSSAKPSFSSAGTPPQPSGSKESSKSKSSASSVSSSGSGKSATGRESAGREGSSRPHGGAAGGGESRRSSTASSASMSSKSKTPHEAGSGDIKNKDKSQASSKAEKNIASKSEKDKVSSRDSPKDCSKEPRKDTTKDSHVDSSKDKDTVKEVHKDLNKDTKKDSPTLQTENKVDHKKHSSQSESKPKAVKSEKHDSKTEKSNDSEHVDNKKKHSTPSNPDKHKSEKDNSHWNNKIKDKSSTDKIEKPKDKSNDQLKHSDKNSVTSDKHKVNSKSKDRTSSVDKHTPETDTKTSQVEKKHKTDHSNNTKPTIKSDKSSSKLQDTPTSHKSNHKKSSDSSKSVERGVVNHVSEERERRRDERKQQRRRAEESGDGGGEARSSRKNKRREDKSPPTTPSRDRNSDGGSAAAIQARELKMLRDALGSEAYLLDEQQPQFMSMYDSIKSRSCRRTSTVSNGRSGSRQLQKTRARRGSLFDSDSSRDHSSSGSGGDSSPAADEKPRNRKSGAQQRSSAQARQRRMLSTTDGHSSSSDDSHRAGPGVAKTSTQRDPISDDSSSDDASIGGKPAAKTTTTTAKSKTANRRKPASVESDPSSASTSPSLSSDSDVVARKPAAKKKTLSKKASTIQSDTSDSEDNAPPSKVSAAKKSTPTKTKNSSHKTSEKSAPTRIPNGHHKPSSEKQSSITKQSEPPRLKKATMSGSSNSDWSDRDEDEEMPEAKPAPPAAPAPDSKKSAQRTALERLESCLFADISSVEGGGQAAPAVVDASKKPATAAAPVDKPAKAGRTENIKSENNKKAVQDLKKEVTDNKTFLEVDKEGSEKPHKGSDRKSQTHSHKKDKQSKTDHTDKKDKHHTTKSEQKDKQLPKLESPVKTDTPSSRRPAIFSESDEEERGKADASGTAADKQDSSAASSSSSGSDSGSSGSDSQDSESDSDTHPEIDSEFMQHMKGSLLFSSDKSNSGKNKPQTAAAKPTAKGPASLQKQDPGNEAVNKHKGEEKKGESSERRRSSEAGLQEARKSAEVTRKPGSATKQRRASEARSSDREQASEHKTPPSLSRDTNDRKVRESSDKKSASTTIRESSDRKSVSRESKDPKVESREKNDKVKSRGAKTPERRKSTISEPDRSSDSRRHHANNNCNKSTENIFDKISTKDTNAHDSHLDLPLTPTMDENPATPGYDDTHNQSMDNPLTPGTEQESNKLFDSSDSDEKSLIKIPDLKAAASPDLLKVASDKQSRPITPDVEFDSPVPKTAGAEEEGGEDKSCDGHRTAASKKADAANSQPVKNTAVETEKAVKSLECLLDDIPNHTIIETNIIANVEVGGEEGEAKVNEDEMANAIMSICGGDGGGDTARSSNAGDQATGSGYEEQPPIEEAATVVYEDYAAEVEAGGEESEIAVHGLLAEDETFSALRNLEKSVSELHKSASSTTPTTGGSATTSSGSGEKRVMGDSLSMAPFCAPPPAIQASEKKQIMGDSLSMAPFCDLPGPPPPSQKSTPKKEKEKPNPLQLLSQELSIDAKAKEASVKAEPSKPSPVVLQSPKAKRAADKQKHDTLSILSPNKLESGVTKDFENLLTQLSQFEKPGNNAVTVASCAEKTPVKERRKSVLSLEGGVKDRRASVGEETLSARTQAESKTYSMLRGGKQQQQDTPVCSEPATVATPVDTVSVSKVSNSSSSLARFDESPAGTPPFYGVTPLKERIPIEELNDFEDEDLLPDLIIDESPKKKQPKPAATANEKKSEGAPAVSQGDVMSSVAPSVASKPVLTSPPVSTKEAVKPVVSSEVAVNKPVSTAAPSSQHAARFSVPGPQRYPSPVIPMSFLPSPLVSPTARPTSMPHSAPQQSPVDSRPPAPTTAAPESAHTKPATTEPHRAPVRQEATQQQQVRTHATPPQDARPRPTLPFDVRLRAPGPMEAGPRQTQQQQQQQHADIHARMSVPNSETLRAHFQPGIPDAVMRHFQHFAAAQENANSQIRAQQQQQQQQNSQMGAARPPFDQHRPPFDQKLFEQQYNRFPNFFDHRLMSPFDKGLQLPRFDLPKSAAQARNFPGLSSGSMAIPTPTTLGMPSTLPMPSTMVNKPVESPVSLSTSVRMPMPSSIAAGQFPPSLSLPSTMSLQSVASLAASVAMTSPGALPTPVTVSTAVHMQMPALPTPPIAGSKAVPAVSPKPPASKQGSQGLMSPGSKQDHVSNPLPSPSQGMLSDAQKAYAQIQSLSQQQRVQLGSPFGAFPPTSGLMSRLPADFLRYRAPMPSPVDIPQSSVGASLGSKPSPDTSTSHVAKPPTPGPAGVGEKSAVGSVLSPALRAGPAHSNTSHSSSSLEPAMPYGANLGLPSQLSTCFTVAHTIPSSSSAPLFSRNELPHTVVSTMRAVTSQQPNSVFMSSASMAAKPVLSSSGIHSTTVASSAQFTTSLPASSGTLSVASIAPSSLPAPRSSAVAVGSSPTVGDDSDDEKALQIDMGDAESPLPRSAVVTPPTASRSLPVTSTAPLPSTPASSTNTSSVSPNITPPAVASGTDSTVVKDSPKIVPPKKAFKFNHPNHVAMSEDSRKTTTTTPAQQPTEAATVSDPAAPSEETRAVYPEQLTPSKKRSQRAKGGKKGSNAAASEESESASTPVTGGKAQRGNEDSNGATDKAAGGAADKASGGADSGSEKFSSRGRKIIPKDRGDEITTPQTRKSRRQAAAAAAAASEGGEGSLKIKLGRKGVNAEGQSDPNGRKTWALRSKKDSESSEQAPSEKAEEAGQEAATPQKAGPIKITLKRTGKGRKATIQKTTTKEAAPAPVEPPPPDEQEEPVPITPATRKSELPQRPRRTKTKTKGRKLLDIPESPTGSQKRARADGSASPRSRSVESASPRDLAKSYVRLDKLSVDEMLNKDMYEFDGEEERPAALRGAGGGGSRKRKTSSSSESDTKKHCAGAAAPGNPKKDAIYKAEEAKRDTPSEPEPRKPDMNDILQRGHLPLKLAMKWEAQQAKEREAKEAALKAEVARLTPDDTGRSRSVDSPPPSKESPVAAHTAGGSAGQTLPSGVAPKVTSPPSGVQASAATAAFSAAALTAMSPHLTNALPTPGATHMSSLGRQTPVSTQGGLMLTISPAYTGHLPTLHSPQQMSPHSVRGPSPRTSSAAHLPVSYGQPPLAHSSHLSNASLGATHDLRNKLKQEAHGRPGSSGGQLSPIDARLPASAPDSMSFPLHDPPRSRANSKSAVAVSAHERKTPVSTATAGMSEHALLSLLAAQGGGAGAGGMLPPLPQHMYNMGHMQGLLAMSMGARLPDPRLLHPAATGGPHPETAAAMQQMIAAGMHLPGLLGAAAAALSGDPRPGSSHPPLPSSRPAAPTQSSRHSPPQPGDGTPLTPQLPIPPMAALPPGRPPALVPTTRPHAADLPPLKVVYQALHRFPAMWTGQLYLKNDCASVQLHLISGSKGLVTHALGAHENIVRIAQRMRLETTQLDGVAKRMQKEDEYSLLVASPTGKDPSDLMHQSAKLLTGFIQYLTQKQAAGIVNVPNPVQPAYVVHIFPPCEFSHNSLQQRAPELLANLSDNHYLAVVITST